MKRAAVRGKSHDPLSCDSGAGQVPPREAISVSSTARYRVSYGKQHYLRNSQFQPHYGTISAAKRLFPLPRTEKFIKSGQRELDRLGTDYRVIADDTESEIEILITRNPVLLVCAPGLRYQFYHRGLRQTEYCLVRRHGVFLRRSPFCAQEA